MTLFRMELNFTVQACTLEEAVEAHDRLLDAAEAGGLNYEGGHVGLLDDDETELAAMADLLKRYDAVSFLAVAVWVCAGGAIAALVDREIGLWLMVGPVLLLLLVSAFVPIIRMARDQLRRAAS